MKCKVSGKNGYIQEEDCHCFCCGEHNPKHQIKDNLTPCSKCNCMTKSIRLGRANYQCGKCKHDKSLSDYLYREATQKKDRSCAK